MNAVTLTMKPYIQPFEKRLACLELGKLLGLDSCSFNFIDEVTVRFDGGEPRVPVAALANRLAYWETIQTDGLCYTQQVLREATVNAARQSGAAPQLKQGSPALPKRRCLRYATHGIHEYRGKYFPQLVRALLNLAGLGDSGRVVLDPMCGSGTTAVETILAGHDAVGIDMNPLSAFIAEAKCAALTLSPKALEAAFREMQRQLQSSATRRVGKTLRYCSSLPPADQEYLAAWFSAEALAELDAISLAIDKQRNPVMRRLFKVSLSNILRRVSFQKDGDLRARRADSAKPCLSPVTEYLKELERTTGLLLAFLRLHGSQPLGGFRFTVGDARKAASIAAKVDAVITSPPYSTALPYLDTDRLSLVYLGLLPREEHRAKDQDMIGNREVTPKQRAQLWQDFQEQAAAMPPSAVRLIERVHALNASAEVGFRRKNLSSLLGKYFLDMRAVLREMHAVLATGASMFLVVGNNHTTAGGQHVDINTSELLADLAEMEGFSVHSKLAMDMLPSREIYRKNALKSETILWLTKPS